MQLPPGILQDIFFNVVLEQGLQAYGSLRRVCHDWDDILSSRHFRQQHQKAWVESELKDVT